MHMHFNSRHILRREPPFACIFPACEFVSTGGDRNPDAYCEFADHIITVHRMRIAGVTPGTKTTRTTEGDPATLTVQSTDKIAKDRIKAIKQGQIRLPEQGPALAHTTASDSGRGKAMKQEPKGKGKGKEVEKNEEASSDSSEMSAALKHGTATLREAVRREGGRIKNGTKRSFAEYLIGQRFDFSTLRKAAAGPQPEETEEPAKSRKKKPSTTGKGEEVDRRTEEKGKGRPRGGHEETAQSSQPKDAVLTLSSDTEIEGDSGVPFTIACADRRGC